MIGITLASSCTKIWFKKKKLGSHLTEVPGRRIGPQMLAKTAKKRPLDPKGATSEPKRSKLIIIADTKVPEDTESGERVQLDERTTQILEEELQAIMIKVWQTLPDNPPSAAERYVTDQLRNEASDDIRNVLGLNVTKRLLNVFNPLYLRISLTSKPGPEELQQFAKTHNIIEMRSKYAGGQLSYIVRVASVADFDRLCNARNLRCGNLTVTGQPYYRFNDLPMRLNTGFVKKINLPSKSKQEAADKEITQSSSNEKIVKQATSSSESKQQNVKSKPISRNDQLPKTTNKNESDNNKVTAQSDNNKVNVAKKVESNQNTKKVEIASVKKNNVTLNKVSETKPNIVKTAQNVQKTTTQSNAPKPTQVTRETTTVKIEKTVSVEKTPTPTSVTKPKPNQDNQEVVATKKVTEATAKTTTNITQPKPNQINKESVAKKVIESKPKTTVTTNQGVATKKLETTPKAVTHTGKPNVTQPKQNQVNKVVATKKEAQVNKEVATTKKENQVNNVATKKVTESKPKLTIKNVEMINAETFDENYEMDEDDEMDDEEILALISTGVIVDECSGSDEE